MTNVVDLNAARQKTEITRNDILPLTEYAKIRAERRRALVTVKKNRRIPIGPHATFYFENYETMWQQIHEMLFIEKGGEEQIADELAAYNPLIPKGDELVATLMFEIDDERLRKSVLGRLGGVEQSIYFKFGAHKVMAEPEMDVDRTSADGKASSVQFLHFKFSPEEIVEFCSGDDDIILGIGHENYPHMTVLQPGVVTALGADFAQN